MKSRAPFGSDLPLSRLCIQSEIKALIQVMDKRGISICLLKDLPLPVDEREGVLQFSELENINRAVGLFKDDVAVRLGSRDVTCNPRLIKQYEKLGVITDEISSKLKNK